MKGMRVIIVFVVMIVGALVGFFLFPANSPAVRIAFFLIFGFIFGMIAMELTEYYEDKWVFE